MITEEELAVIEKWLQDPDSSYSVYGHKHASALFAEVRRLQEVIRVNQICHNLHGKVDAIAFAEGCANEQRKLYGQAPDADLVAKLREENRRLRDTLAAVELAARQG